MSCFIKSNKQVSLFRYLYEKGCDRTLVKWLARGRFRDWWISLLTSLEPSIISENEDWQKTKDPFICQVLWRTSRWGTLLRGNSDKKSLQGLSRKSRCRQVNIHHGRIVRLGYYLVRSQKGRISCPVSFNKYTRILTRISFFHYIVRISSTHKPGKRVC